MREPNPLCVGCVTGGPPVSAQVHSREPSRPARSPRNFDVTVEARQRAVFGGVGRKLMQRAMERRRRPGRNGDVRSLQAEPVAVASMRFDRRPDDVPFQRPPAFSRWDVLRPRHSDETSPACARFRHRNAVSRGLVRDRLHRGRHILHAMTQFVSEQYSVLLGFLAFGDVDCCSREARRPSRRVVIATPLRQHPTHRPIDLHEAIFL